MPKQMEISPTFLMSELKKRSDVFCKNGCLVGKKSEFWTDLKNKLQLRMLPESLYLLVYKNKLLIEELRNHFKINKTEEKEISSNSDSDYIPNCEIKNPYNCEKLEFVIEIPNNELIKCLKSKMKKEEWTDKIRTEIWKEKNLPCPFALNGYITSNKFKFCGQCSDCKSGIIGESTNNLEENFVKINVNTFQTYEIPHSKKIKLKGSRRCEIKRILHHQTGSNYREGELEKVTTSYEPPHLNSTITLRKAREEGLDELIGYKEFKGLSIANKKFLEQCSVRKLSLNPFYVIYFSDSQINFWNSIQHKMLPLSFDSTGSLVQKYNFYAGIKSKTIFYYVIVVGVAGKIIPLVQALLSIHHVPVIQEILERWVESGAKVPREIRTDGSLALQNAICLSFNKMTYKMYNTKCFNVLLDEQNNQLPSCYYRHDVAHLLKAVAEWKCLKENTEAIRHFYLRSIGYLTQVNTLDKFVDVVTSITVIANYPLAEEGSKPYQSLSQMMQLFKTYKHRLDELTIVTEANNSFKDSNEPLDIHVDPESDSRNTIILFIDDLFRKILSECPVDDQISDKANFYYCPEFTKLFKGLCYTFPSWTNCMKHYFSSPNEVGTSARSETNFKCIKSSISHPLKVQKFILTDCKRNKSLVKVGELRIKEKEQLNCQRNIFDLSLDDLISLVNNKHREHEVTSKKIKNL